MNNKDAGPNTIAARAKSGNTRALLKNALLELKAMRKRMELVKSEPIAIIGLGCRFPGAANPAAFWQLLHDGVDAISEVPSERWDIDAYYDASPDAAGKMHTRYGGFLPDASKFDAHFFGISPREANSLDPQQRLLLEVAWEALENAGISAKELFGSLTGVFVGITTFDYGMRLLNDEARINPYIGTGSLLSPAAGRLSYLLGLTGPSMAVDTACSSSLVALDLAVMKLRNRKCDLALAGGVNMLLAPGLSINFSKARMLAPDGRCKTFDARANGYVRAEGCGVIVLKRLSDALAEGDHILALIRGSAVNQDGASGGLTVPSGPSQEAVIRQALKNARVAPSQVSYIEAHGTGTGLGDPIEVGALGDVFGQRSHPLFIGSVKTNFGHLEAAAGIAGVIKVVLALQHGEIPAHLHFDKPNPHISWDNLPLKIPTEGTPWLNGCPRHVGAIQTSPRIAGVSSFGFSGTNAHVILEEAPASEEARGRNGNGKGNDTRPLAHSPTRPLSEGGATRPLHLLTLSAKTEPALQELVSRYAAHLAEAEDELADVCFTANTGRAHFEYRLSVLASSSAEMAQKLRQLHAGQDVSGIRQGEVTGEISSGMAFLFTGQGSQYVGMGRELYEIQPTFRKTIEQCDEIWRSTIPSLPRDASGQASEGSLINLLFGDERINQTVYTQPALFALEYALAKLWQSWGVVPDVVMGHSVGEVVAACVAGVFSLADGLNLVYERGRLMQSTQKGEMAALFTSEQRVREALGQHGKQGLAVSIAAVNGPQLTVISGHSQAVQALVRSMSAEGIRTKNLNVSHAFHSPLITPILEPFRDVARQITFSAPRIALISNLTGQLVSQEVTTPDYWVRHIRQPVRFADSMTCLQQLGIDTFVEIGPKPTLLGMGRQALRGEGASFGLKNRGRGGDNFWLPSLRPDAEWSTLLASVAQLYLGGTEIDWKGFDQGLSRGTRDHARRKVHLPTYPFQRKRYWLETEPTRSVLAPNTRSLHPLVHRRQPTPKQVIFESQLSANKPAYLADHRAFETTILPASAYLEMVLAAAALQLGTDQLELSDVSWQLPLSLASEQVTTVQLILTPHAEGYSFEFFSMTTEEGKDEEWRAHAQGLVRANPSIAHSVDLESLKAGYPEKVALGAYYQKIAAVGMHYGPSFQAIDQLFLSSAPDQRDVLGRVRLPEALLAEARKYKLHPVLLDACFQLSFAIIGREDQLYLPFALTALQLYAPALESTLWVAAKGQGARGREGEGARGRGEETLTVELELFNESGAKVADVKGLTLRAADRAFSAQRAANWESWLYELLWQAKKAAPTLRQAQGGGGCWLILADGGGIAQQVVHRLTEQGARCVRVFAGTQRASYQQVDRDCYHVNPAAKEEFERLISAIEQPIVGIVHLWSLETEEGDAGRACASVLHLVQALSPHRNPPRLWLVTRGAQAVSHENAKEAARVALWQAPLWGLGRVIAQEHPELKCVCVDLSPEGDQRALGSALFDELWQQDGEDQVAFRDGERYVARLVPKFTSSGEGTEGVASLSVPPHANQSFQLRLSEYGILDNLHLAPLKHRPLAAGEVEIEVRAAALNFRDVLNALGMLKEYYAEHLGIHNAVDVRFGFECAGVISRVGHDVPTGHDISGFNVGDEVIASLVSGALASSVHVRAEFVVPKPPKLTSCEAATIPLAFLTAAYGLEHLAQLRAGERVLIHSAAGGVGQAAVQVAQAVGAEIFATASPGKWDVLKAQGIKHIYNSRTLEFAEQVLLDTEGQGVDVVLNSLSGDFIPKSLQVLAEGGRFVEIGKLGVWAGDKVHSVRPDVAYFVFDLGEVADDDPALIRQLFNGLMAEFAADRLSALPHKVFSLDDVVDAFGYMQRAKHIGKIVIQMPAMTAHQRERGAIDKHGSYLITGGLGALGLQMADFLVAQGARHLILTGRRGAASDAAQEAVRQLEEKGAKVQVVKADVSKADDVAKLLSRAEPSLRPAPRPLAPSDSLSYPIALRGVIHAAGVLDDGVLTSQSWSRFENVMAPKVQGAWNLHQLTQDMPLDFFVLFSSAASLLGSAGQGNYAAANAFMDALAHHRHALGLPALSINWGPWAEGGMASSEQVKDRLASSGWQMITPSIGSQIVERLLGTDAAQVGVLPLDWTRFGATNATSLIKGLHSQPTASHAPVLEQVKSAVNPHAALQAHIRRQIGNVLLMSAEQIKPRQRLFDLGLDSLMAVELKNRLEADLARSLRSTLLFHYPTLEALSDYLAQEVLGQEDEALLSEPGVLEEAQEEAQEENQGTDSLLANELAQLEMLLGEV